MSRKFFSLAMAIAILFLLSQCGITGEKGNNVQEHKYNKYKLDIYVTNFSFTDTLALARILINDSVCLNKFIHNNKIDEEIFQKAIYIGKGVHRISTHFGRYSKDTIYNIKSNSSLMISMNYNPKWQPQDNGMMIHLLARDSINRGED